jgi:hypothetical protein
MNICFVAGLLFFGLLARHPIGAQTADPNLLREVAAIRAEVARSLTALRQYTWTEHTEVSVKGDVKSSTDLICRYDGFGKLTKNPMGGTGKDMADGNAISKRPRERKKADKNDYIERAISMIQSYVPPNPEKIDYLLSIGYASLGQQGSGKAEIRFKRYYQDGDTLVYTYDPVSKALLGISVASTLGSPKDPVTMEAVFETLPDGVNHLASTILTAPAKKVQIKTRNVMYQKVSN